MFSAHDVTLTQSEGEEMPRIMPWWLVVPLIDISTGVFNFYRYNDDEEIQDDMRYNEIFGVLTGLVNLGAWYQATISQSSTDPFNIISRVAIAWELVNCGLTFFSYRNIYAFDDDMAEERFNILMRAAALTMTVVAVRPIYFYLNGRGEEETVESTDADTETTDPSYDAGL